MHTRICTQVCKFLEMISKDGMCSLLRLTSLSGGLVGQHLFLCHSSSPSTHLPPPPLPLSISSVLPSSLSSPAFLPWLARIVLASQCPVDFCLFRVRVSASFFFVKIQIENIVGLCAILCLLQLLTFAVVAQRGAEIIHQKMAVSVFQ